MDSNVVHVDVTQRQSAGYPPTVWDPELINSFSSPYTYESNGTRLEELKQAAKLLFTSLNQTEQKLDLINTMQRLGIAKHFAKEIKEAIGSVPEPQFYKCKRNITKFGSLATVVDDVYDVYGSLDELDAYTNAVNRWDVKAIEELPEYMKVCYLAMYNHVNEMVEDASKDHGFDILPYIKDQWVYHTRSMHVEATWYYGLYMPTLEEYLKNGCISIGIPIGLTYAFFGGLAEDSKSQHTFPLQLSDSELFYFPSLIVRLLDDVNTSKLEMEKEKTTNSIQCYMIQEGVSQEEARDHMKGLISGSLKKLNKCITDNHSLPIAFANAALSMIRCVQLMYQFGDWFAIQTKANKDCVTSSLFNPIQVQANSDDVKVKVAAKI
ncbi:hypothetical protein REPUB_Repub03eG0128800 [Reevesia pubescens]